MENLSMLINASGPKKVLVFIDTMMVSSDEARTLAAELTKAAAIADAMSPIITATGPLPTPRKS